jgi:small subunit ribosomal protein S20
VANIKSAKKRILVTRKKTAENKMVKSKLATLTKKVEVLVAEGKKEDAKKMLPEVVAFIDSCASDGVIHKNTASRKVSRLTKLVG